jgi:hypothetical protein
MVVLHCVPYSLCPYIQGGSLAPTVPVSRGSKCRRTGLTSTVPGDNRFWAECNGCL